MPSLTAAWSVDIPGRLALFWWETEEEWIWRRREWGRGWEEWRETAVGLQCIRKEFFKKKEKKTRGEPLVTRASE